MTIKEHTLGIIFLIPVILVPISGLAITVNVFWIAIEFLIYLFKDVDFNWLSVRMGVYCTITLLICKFLSDRITASIEKKYPQIKSIYKRSK